MSAATAVVIEMNSGQLVLADDEGAAMWIIADAVFMDSECKIINTEFGAIFQYGEAHGIQTIDIMPLGRWRK